MGSVGDNKRYTSGWRSRDQDKASNTRVARAQRQNFEQVRKNV